VRAYGIPVHAWNEAFFRLCVSENGRFTHADECTVDKAHLDFARILVSTTQLEILNTSSKFVIDGRRYVIKLVEEWGCHLGKDAFMMEVDYVSTPEMFSQPRDDASLEEVQGEWELDDLVTDLQQEWNQHEVKKDASLNTHQSMSNGVKGKEGNSEFFKVQLSPVLQPLTKSNIGTDCNGTKGIKQPARATDIAHPGPWSTDWMSKQRPILDGGVVFSSSCEGRKSKEVKQAFGKSNSSTHSVASNKKKVGMVNKSVGFMKKIARMSASDRKQILKILKKQKRRKKVCAVKACSNAAVGSTLDSSLKSTSSVRNDWENCVFTWGT